MHRIMAGMDPIHPGKILLTGFLEPMADELEKVSVYSA